MADLLALASAKLGQTVDMDGMYGGQCMDLIVYVVQTAYGVHMGGNAIDTGSASNIAALQNAGVKVQRITNRSQLQRGDIVVFSDGGYGHVAIVEEPTHPTLVQQNINGRQYVTRDSFAWSDYYGLSFAYGLRLGDSTPKPDPDPEEEIEMLKLFRVNEGHKSLRVMNTATGKSVAVDATGAAALRAFLKDEPTIERAQLDTLNVILGKIS
ncbi:CHAP domain-containing protein [Lactococcus petauri]|uniref:CHAP domain-containing protein n=1 Tax=Lactococcus petauri TaxID=1940789 RepID=UPI003851F588